MEMVRGCNKSKVLGAVEPQAPFLKHEIQLRSEADQLERDERSRRHWLVDFRRHWILPQAMPVHPDTQSHPKRFLSHCSLNPTSSSSVGGGRSPKIQHEFSNLAEDIT